MRVLLLSTYELGSQPLGCAVPGAVLRAAGHEVVAVDLAVEAWPAHELIDGMEAVAISVPMHTALRLASSVLDRLRARWPDLPVALHGLYAPVGVAAGLLRSGDLAVAGVSDTALLEWLDGLTISDGSAATRGGREGRGVRDAAGPTVRVELGPARPERNATGILRPWREGLPPLSAYARYLPGDGSERLAGAVEATRGCSHRCRHCPVPVVYDGRTRVVELDAVLADVDQLVGAGAEHIHFGDPDFLNRPGHALAVARGLHAAFPSVTFDATVKVSHILGHRDIWPELAGLGCTLVVTAIESVSPVVLERLDKGHDAAEAAEAVVTLRKAGIEPRPSLLPFTPWTTKKDLVELLDFAAVMDLVWNVDPVQWGIRLLLPPGSLLVEESDAVLRACLGDLDPEALGWTWQSPDPLIDALAESIACLTEEATCATQTVGETYAAVRTLTFEVLGITDPGPRPHPLESEAQSRVPGPERPRLSESWFCCAEPTAAQRSRADGPSISACG